MPSYLLKKHQGLYADRRINAVSTPLLDSIGCQLIEAFSARDIKCQREICMGLKVHTLSDKPPQNIYVIEPPPPSRGVGAPPRGQNPYPSIYHF